MSTWQINDTHIDHYRHTNNVAYLTQLEQLAWKHSQSLGLSFGDYEKFDRAMVITQHQLNYHLASHLHDQLACATWIVACDNKYRLSRQFQFININTNKTVFSALTHFVCVSLTSGLPRRMPAQFLAIYGKAVISHREQKAQ